MSTFGDFKSPFSKESSEEEALSGSLGGCTLRHNNHTSTTLSSLSNSSRGGEDEETDLEVASLTNGKMGSSPCSSSSSSTGHQPKPENGKVAAKRRRAPDMQLGRCKWVRLFDNITYIVAAIILREAPPESHSNGTNGNHSSKHGLQMLLIQEAKKKCLGKWYIPAGRMEPGETIEQGVKREVLEETGFNCSVDQLVCTEIRGSGWYRMGFACSITGGELKTVPDRESLCAGWHSVDTVKSCMDAASSSNGEKWLQLRCRDFFPNLG
uniref:Nudix hydrolase domain-containing protein n=1 Tax=Ditylenchus dipsaci TaxID=166011 RepID=A0A915DIV6_9BILA